MLKKIDSDIELGSMKQFSASLLAKDNTPDASNWTSELPDDGKMIVRQMRLLRTYVVRELQIGRLDYETIFS